jgi:hypothetical protein
VRKGVAFVLALTWLVACQSAPFVHVHDRTSQHFDHALSDNAAVVHAHASPTVLHSHRQDGFEMSTLDDEQASHYLNAFQVDVNEISVLACLLHDIVEAERPAITRATHNNIDDCANHDPPFASNFPPRAPPV